MSLSWWLETFKSVNKFLHWLDDQVALRDAHRHSLLLDQGHCTISTRILSRISHLILEIVRVLCLPPALYAPAGSLRQTDPSLCLRVSRWHRGHCGPVRGQNFGCSRHGPKPQTDKQGFRDIFNKSVSKRRSNLGSKCMTLIAFLVLYDLERWRLTVLDDLVPHWWTDGRCDSLSSCRSQKWDGKNTNDFRTSGLSLDKILFIALSSFIVDTACAVLRVLWLTPENCFNTIFPVVGFTFPN